MELSPALTPAGAWSMPYFAAMELLAAWRRARPAPELKREGRHAPGVSRLIRALRGEVE